MNQRKILGIGAIVIVSLAVTLTFQNCGKVQVLDLENGGAIVAGDEASSPVTMTDEPQDDDGSADDPTVTTTTTPTIATLSPTTSTTLRVIVEVPPQNDGSTEELNYVCVLSGNGKSRLASYIDNRLTSDVSTPQTICTTRAGCEYIGKYLSVKEIVKKGSCKNNPQVIRMHLDELRGLTEGN